MDKIHEWVNCDDFTSFKPLRMIINGGGGTGKSVIINTIVSTMRQMFQNNGVVKVVAPTGTAAFNVNGETFHHLLKNRVTKTEYKPFTMSKEKENILKRRFSGMLALICDERSLITSNVLGTAEQMISETIYNGHLQDHSWGGLPIVILVGDDYQLPGVGEGPLKALINRGGGKMTRNGREVLKECSKFVMELKKSYRVQEQQQQDKELIERLRVGDEIPECDIDKLLSLHLDNIRLNHGNQKVHDIKSKAMFLFFRNEKRIRHNLEQVALQCSPTNPVGINKTHATGPNGGKSVRAHFEDNNLPSSSLLCVGAKVALQGRNFCPQWGLHNGACGTVHEIIYEKDNNPNFGNLPKYVIVEFPQYIGPTWDIDNPKVRILWLIIFDFTTNMI